ncbi:hypothetical protein [Marinilactibacillus kalidii]|uniref:hypothetical protein n=1 Tax=Marinilactibacillus kalidii TaxID=2820274 RepID=UPI001ABE61A0|nr:hypothetical protein [Marinilactibacillus kalidii]
MKELFVIPTIVFGVVVAILLIVNSTKSKAEKTKEQIVTLSMMSAMFGQQLSKMKKIVMRIYLFQFSLLFGYTLISIWINFYTPLTRYLLILMSAVLLLELVIKVSTIHKAKQFQDIINKKKSATITSYIYLLCIAVSIGTMI